MPPELDYVLSDRENAELLALADAHGLTPEAMAAELTEAALHRIAGSTPNRVDAVVYPFPPPKRPVKDPATRGDEA